MLSPILFYLYTFDFEPSLQNILQYADDLVLYARGNSASSLCSHLSESLDYLKMWMEENSLDVSTSKSSLVLFTWQRIPIPIAIDFDYNKIPVKKQVKLLGIFLASKHTGVPHSLCCKFLTMESAYWIWPRNVDELRKLDSIQSRWI